MASFSVVNNNVSLLIPPIAIKQHTIMLSILSLLSFAVIATCSNVTIEFHLKSVPECSNVSMPPLVTFYVLKKHNSSLYHYCHIYEGKLKL